MEKDGFKLGSSTGIVEWFFGGLFCTCCFFVLAYQCFKVEFGFL